MLYLGVKVFRVTLSVIKNQISREVPAPAGTFLFSIIDKSQYQITKDFVILTEG
jgi:hypothetical protein